MSVVTMYDTAMLLAFLCIGMLVHLVFNNIRDILWWSCKFWTTVALWSILWVCTQLDQLDTWHTALQDSVWRLVNMTRIVEL